MVLLADGLLLTGALTLATLAVAATKVPNPDESAAAPSSAAVSTSSPDTAQPPEAASPAPQPTPSSAPAPAAHAIQFPKPVMDVLRLVDAKVGPDVIKAFIQNSSVPYHLSADQIVALKERGIAPALLAALVQHGAQVGARPGMPPAPPYPGGPDLYGPAPYYPGYGEGLGPVPDNGYSYGLENPNGYPSYSYASPYSDLGDWGYPWGWYGGYAGWPYIYGGFWPYGYGYGRYGYGRYGRGFGNRFFDNRFGGFDNRFGFVGRGSYGQNQFGRFGGRPGFASRSGVTFGGRARLGGGMRAGGGVGGHGGGGGGHGGGGHR
jgi:hypothetical protein